MVFFTSFTFFVPPSSSASPSSALSVPTVFFPFFVSPSAPPLTAVLQQRCLFFPRARCTCLTTLVLSSPSIGNRVACRPLALLPLTASPSIGNRVACRPLALLPLTH